MRQQVCVGFQRAVGIRVPVRVKAEPHLGKLVAASGAPFPAASRSAPARRRSSGRISARIGPPPPRPPALLPWRPCCCCMALSWPFSLRTEAGSCSCGRTNSACTNSTTPRKIRMPPEQQHPAQPRPAPPLRIHEDERASRSPSREARCSHRRKRKKPSAFSVVLRRDFSGRYPAQARRSAPPPAACGPARSVSRGRAPGAR